MPRVPTAQPQVQSRALPGVRAQNLDVSSGFDALAQGTAQAGAGLVRVGERHEKELEQLNRARVQDAWTRHAAKQSDILRGAMERRGQKAAGVDGWGLAEFDKSLEEVAKELTPEQRKMLGSVAQKDRVSFENALKNHRDKEFQTFKDEAAVAAAEGAISKGALIPTDEGRAEAYRLGEAALVAREVDRGAPQAVIDQKRRVFATAFHGTRMEQLVAAGDAAGLRGYLDTHGPTMEPGARAKWQKTAEALGRDAEAEGMAGRILQGARVEGYDWLDPTRALAAVESVPAGPMRDEVRQRVEHQVQKAEALRERAGKEALNRVLAIYGESGNPNDPRIAPIKAWMLDPANGAADLWNRFRNDVEADARARRTEARVVRNERSTLEQELVRDFRAREPEERATLDLAAEYTGRGASKSTLDLLRAEQMKARDTVRKGQAPAEAEFYRTTRAEAVASGLTQKQAQDAFVAHMATWRAEYLEKSGGKPPTREEVKRAQADALLYGDRGGMLSRNHFKFQAKPGERFVPFAAEEQKSPLNRGAPQKVPVVGPGGQRGMADAEGLEAWLAAHPEWRRQ